MLKKGVQQNGVRHSAIIRVSCLQALSFIGRCLGELGQQIILVSHSQQILPLWCSEGSAKGAAPKKGSKAKPKDVQAERVQQRKSRKREKASRSSLHGHRACFALSCPCMCAQALHEQGKI